MYKYAIFDLDGTLLNTIEDLADAGNFALKEMGYPQHETEKYKYFVGNGIPKLIERIVPENTPKENIQKVHDIFSEYYNIHCMDKTQPYPEIPQVLESLNEKGVITAVASNKDHSFSQLLVEHYFGDKIHIVCGRKDGVPKKPDPFIVNSIIKQLNAEKNQVLYIGDSNVDMETAKNAGLDSCGVLWGFRTKRELEESGAVYIAQKPYDLYDIIRQHRTISG